MTQIKTQTKAQRRAARTRATAHRPAHRAPAGVAVWTGRVLVAVCIAGVLGGARCSQRKLSSVRVGGHSAFEAGDYAAAEQLYREYVERSPGLAEARLWLGRSLLRQGEALAAREEFAIAHKLEPDDPRFILAFAEGLRHAGQVEQGYVFLLEQAGQRRGVEDYLRLGRYAEGGGLTDEAERAYRIAAALAGGSDPTPQRELAELYRQAGDRSREVDRLRVLMFLEPEDAAVIERLRELGQVPGPSFALPPEALGDAVATTLIEG